MADVNAAVIEDAETDPARFRAVDAEFDRRAAAGAPLAPGGTASGAYARVICMRSDGQGRNAQLIESPPADVSKSRAAS